MNHQIVQQHGNYFSVINKKICFIFKKRVETSIKEILILRNNVIER